MKQLKIKQEFLDNIKNGIKNFEIRKKDYGFKDWTKVELYTTDICTYYENCKGCRRCVNEILIVELKQTPMTAFDIGSKIYELIDDTQYKVNGKKIRYELEFVFDFWHNYFKQGDTLYWYDLRLVE